MRVLIIEDDERIAAFVRSGLIEHSHSVTIAADAETGLQEALDSGFSVIVLDLMLPGGSGEEILTEIRGRGIRTPVIVLTAKDSVSKKVSLLDLGADDYLTKPFSLSELSARMRALVRRPTTTADVLISGDLVVDPRSRIARRREEPLDLTTKEFNLLMFFAENEGRVLTRRIIAEAVWDETFESYSNVIDVHINRLRRKVDGPFETKLIHTIRGVGYVLREE